MNLVLKLQELFGIKVFYWAIKCFKCSLARREFPTTDYPSLDKHVEVDVVVVGADFAVFLLLGIYLNKVYVWLWLRHETLHMATGRNAGFILQGTAEGTIVPEQMGREKARLVHHLSVENHRLMREWIDTHASDCEYRKGVLQLHPVQKKSKNWLSRLTVARRWIWGWVAYGDELGEPYLSAGFQTGIICLRTERFICKVCTTRRKIHEQA